MRINNKFVLNSVMFCGLLFAGLAQAQPPSGPMSFFVTSQGSGNGGDLGGLAGRMKSARTWQKAPTRVI